MKKKINNTQNSFISRNRVIIYIIAATALFNAVIIIGFLKVDNYLYNREIKDYEAGKVAVRDIIAEYDFKYIDRKSTAKRDYELEKNITPVFKIYKEINDETFLKFNNFYDQFKRIHVNTFSDEWIEPLYDNFSESFPGISRPLFINLLEKPSVLSLLDLTSDILVSVMEEGIVDFDSNDSRMYHENDIIEIWRWRNNSREKEEISFSDMLSLNSIDDFIKKESVVKGKDLSTVSELIKLFAVENCFYDYQETTLKRERILSESEPLYTSVKKGELIVKKGFIISETDMSKIKAMGNLVGSTNYRKVSGIILFIISVYFISFIMFSDTVIRKKMTKTDIFFLVILGEIFLIYSIFFYNIVELPDWFNFALLIPAPLFSSIIALIISPAAGISFSIVASFIILPVINFQTFPALFLLFTSLSSVLVVRNVEKRIDLIFSGIKIGLFSIFFTAALSLVMKNMFSTILISSGIAFLNGFVSGILVLGFMPIIEHLLNSPTQFRLIELSDLNNPIFKKMHNLAPGTFNHSLNVGNLAETACREIGANPFLARAGAYYHDIGKIEQAEYFIENQTTYNKHDDLKPSMSVSVIKSHVKIGIEKAKEMGLPQEVIDIIAQHHGNGLISYFYVEALKLENKAKISSEDYSYTEGKPVSREAAVVLLADNIEAAARTLKKPSMSQLEKFVWKIIMSKIETRQITESELTFRELETITESFIKTLAGSYHSRIEYPDIETSEIISSGNGNGKVSKKKKSENE